MTALFESTIDNVSELEVRGYSDPVKMEHIMEIWAKTGDEEYVYKFTGPGVELNILSKIDTENEKFKEKNGELAEENEKLKEAYEKLQQDNTLMIAANEAQHKFIREYAGKGAEVEVDVNYAIESGEEVSYVIVDKEKYESLKNCDCKIRLHGMDFTRDELVDRIKELEELKTPTIENFADEEPRTRADILDQAKKCVCGQREQDYGTPESNFQLIADLWNGYLGFMDHPQDQIRATDVAMMMALLKIARIRNGGGSGDSFVELAGYAACGGEIWNGERHSNRTVAGPSFMENGLYF